jgi:hypothetical protein
MLIEGFKKFGPRFREISDFMGTRTYMQVLTHYRHIKRYGASQNFFNSQSVRSGLWTTEEKYRLKEGVVLYGKDSLTKLA